jgi:hypothetical protein
MKKGYIPELKRLLFTLLSLHLLISCKIEQSDSGIIRFACTELMFSLDEQLVRFKEKVKFQGNDPKDFEIVSTVEKMQSWRTNYQNNKTKEALISYSDSIQKLNSKVNFGLYNKTAELLNARNLVERSNDSSANQNLLFWTLKTEEYLQNYFISQTGNSGSEKSHKLKIYTSSEEYKIGDTIYAAFQVSEVDITGWSFKFDSLYILNNSTQSTIPSTIKKAGPYFIIQSQATQIGDYRLGGQIYAVKHRGYEGYLPILGTSFTVK